MNRLTETIISKSYQAKSPYKNCIQRLGEYEDLGYTPEQLKTMIEKTQTSPIDAADFIIDEIMKHVLEKSPNAEEHPKKIKEVIPAEKIVSGYKELTDKDWEKLLNKKQNRAIKMIVIGKPSEISKNVKNFTKKNGNVPICKIGDKK